MTKEEVWQKVSQIVADYPLLECARCATSVMQWLQDNGIEGKILRLRTKRRSEVFIISAIAMEAMNRLPKMVLIKA